MKKIFLFLVFVLLGISSNYKLLSKDNIKIDVLYFHATIRCEGCLTIENNTRNALKFLFDKELKEKKITFKEYDFLAPKNEHFQTKYGFDSQTLILSKKIKGKEIKWKNLDKIWDYQSDFEKYKNYLKEEIISFMNK